MMLLNRVKNSVKKLISFDLIYKNKYLKHIVKFIITLDTGTSKQGECNSTDWKIE